MSAELIGILSVGAALAGLIIWQVQDLKADRRSLSGRLDSFISEVNGWRVELSERVAKLEPHS